MTSIRALAKSLSGNLTYNEHEETSWDRLTAMALGSIGPPHRQARESLLNSLGISLLAMKLASRLDLLRRSMDDLADCLSWKLKKSARRDRRIIAHQAIREWLVDQCDSCRGSGVEYDGYGVQHECRKCGGLTKRKYSDEERLHTMGIVRVKNIPLAMDTAHAQISFALSLAIRGAQERLR